MNTNPEETDNMKSTPAKLTAQKRTIIIAVVIFFVVAAIVTTIVLVVTACNKTGKEEVKVSIGASCVTNAKHTPAGNGFDDIYRGWYDVQKCGLKQSYCRWQGDDTNLNANPADGTTSGTNRWACTDPTGEYTAQATWPFTTADMSQSEELFKPV
jgi:hypothetical protein